MDSTQQSDSQHVTNPEATDTSHIRTSGAVEDYSTLARIVEAWPRLNPNLKAAIVAIVASQENQVKEKEPEVEM